MAKEAIGIKCYKVTVKTLNDLVVWGLLKCWKKPKSI
jgi:hypothetical protein